MKLESGVSKASTLSAILFLQLDLSFWENQGVASFRKLASPPPIAPAFFSWQDLTFFSALFWFSPTYAFYSFFILLSWLQAKFALMILLDALSLHLIKSPLFPNLFFLALITTSTSQVMFDDICIKHNSLVRRQQDERGESKKNHSQCLCLLIPL